MADKPAAPAPADSGLNPILWVVIILIGLFVFWMAGGGPERAKQEKADNETKNQAANTDDFWTGFSYPTELPDWGSSFSWGSGGGSSRQGDEPAVNERGQKVADSSWKGKVNLGWGDFSTNVTSEEYVTISNSYNGQPVNITGWKLVSPTNSRRPAQFSVIPSGTKLLDEDQRPLEPIILKPGAKASVVSGEPLSTKPFKIKTSFLLNKCLGYLDRLNRDKFSPGFPSSCPDVQDGIDPYLINDRCDSFLSSLGCGTLERDRNNDVWEADNIALYTEGVSSQCLNFAKQRASYAGCLSIHKNDKDFYDDDWVVFLGRRYELWPNRLGNVILLDQSGRLVDQLVY